jgi:hypothetical protein
MLVGAAALGLALLSDLLLARAAWQPVRDEATASRPAPNGKRSTIPS